MITIRPFKDVDWPFICEIHDLARPDELEGSCDARAFVPIEEDQEVEHLKACQKLVAVEGESIKGFVGIQDGYLGWLYVHPSHYGKGIGRRLLRSGLELIQEKAWTIALAGNKRALSLYHSEGFREVHRYKSDNAGFPCTCIRLEKPA